jgi:hypothetical protein
MTVREAESGEGSLGDVTRAPSEVVIIPGGPRPRSHVHAIKPGTALDFAEGRLRNISRSLDVLTDFGEAQIRRADDFGLAPRVSRSLEPRDGYITYASWTNRTGQPVSSFATTWIVPPPPVSGSDEEVIFLFNGIVSGTWTDSWIYQPVLQWGDTGISGESGGNYWLAGSWYVPSSPDQDAFHSNFVRVNTGDVLTGIITLTDQAGDRFAYNCEFSGIWATALPIWNVPELTWLIEALEAYRVKDCSDYPTTYLTRMKSIEVRTGDTRPLVEWGLANFVTNCGQHTTVVSNSAINGEVDIFYRIPGPSASAGANLTASPEFPTEEGRTDVFMVDNLGAVIVFSVIDGLWHPFSTTPPSGVWHLPAAISAAGFSPPGAPLAASRQFGTDDDQTDVFVVDNEGALNVFWVVEGRRWNGPERISNPGFAPAGAPLAASRQFGTDDDQTDVFVVDNEGALNVFWVVEGRRWNGPAAAVFEG